MSDQLRMAVLLKLTLIIVWLSSAQGMRSVAAPRSLQTFPLQARRGGSAGSRLQRLLMQHCRCTPRRSYDVVIMTRIGSTGRHGEVG